MSIYVSRSSRVAGVAVGDLDFHDNSGLLGTLEDNRVGVFSMINSECTRRDGADDNLLKALTKQHARARGVRPKIDRDYIPFVFGTWV